MDGNDTEKDVLLPHMRAKRSQETTKKLNLYLPGFSLLLAPYNSARSDSMRFSFDNKKPCHAVNHHHLCSLEYRDIFIPKYNLYDL